MDFKFCGKYPLHLDDPICSWIAEYNLRKKGYQCIRHPQVTLTDSSLNSHPEIGVNLRASALKLAESLIKSYRMLPICLYALENWDGGLKLLPFRFVKGTEIKCQCRDENNNQVTVDLVIERPIVLIPS